MKSKYKRNIYFGEIGIFLFFRTGILFLLFPHLCFSQFYVSKGAKVFDSDNSLKIVQYSPKAKTEIYIAKGTVIYGLENQSGVSVNISNHKTKKTSPLLAKRKTYDSKNTKKTVSGREETQKQPTLIYKPSNKQGKISFSNGNTNSAVPASPSFSAKNVITGEVKVEIPKVLSHKNQKTFSPENENSIKLPTSHTVRPPPIFCIC